MRQVRQRLETFASSSSVVPEFNDPAIREVLHGIYRIIYHVRNNTCTVVALAHGSRDLQRQWQPDSPK